jgi:hypothetical protein
VAEEAESFKIAHTHHHQARPGGNGEPRHAQRGTVLRP